VTPASTPLPPPDAVDARRPIPSPPASTELDERLARLVRLRGLAALVELDPPRRANLAA
jgi:hypothetical protein